MLLLLLAIIACGSCSSRAEEADAANSPAGGAADDANQKAAAAADAPLLERLRAWFVSEPRYQKGWILLSEGGFAGNGDVQLGIFCIADGDGCVSANGRSRTPEFNPITARDMAALSKSIDTAVAAGNYSGLGYDMFTYRLYRVVRKSSGKVRTKLRLTIERLAGQPDAVAHTELVGEFRKLTL